MEHDHARQHQSPRHGLCQLQEHRELIEEVAAEKGVAVQLEKVEDIQAIMSHGVMSTPGVVIDGKVVHAGGVPTRDKIAGWLAGSVSVSAAEAVPAGGCCSGGKCC